VNEAVIVDAIRSPVGRAHKGGLTGVRPDDLAGAVITALLARNPAVVPDQVDEVITGCGYPWGEQGFNVSRAASLLAGLPDTVPAYTVSRLCASSLQAIRAAAHAVALGEARIVIAAGVESVSRVGRDRHLAEPNPLLDAASPGPTVADYYQTMVQTAENVAARYGVSRQRMDAYAQRSQERAVAAAANGVLAKEIVPIGEFARDDGPRPNSSLERLAGLPPVIDGGTVTAGNSCPLNDGAAAVLVTSEECAAGLGLTPRARVLGSVAVGVDPAMMGVGPVGAITALLERHKLTAADLDVIELNEAFAAQVVPTLEAVGVDPFDDRVNPHGGAIAIGHPFGMTGARIMCSLLNGLSERDGVLGLETMCVGGGQGQAMLVERMS
jgi:acetyl-CoA C-acetyltransferase